MSRSDEFIKEMLLNEGYESDDPLDSGGHTIWGISKRAHPEDFRILAGFKGKQKAAKDFVYEFYKREYYNPLYDKITDVSLAFKIFDFGVNAGRKRAVKILQRLINKYNEVLSIRVFAFADNNFIGEYLKNDFPVRKIKVDGIFGRITLGNVNYFSRDAIRYFLSDDEMIQGETEFYTMYVQELEKYYKSLWNFFRFGKGWLNRLKRIFN